MIYRVFQPDPSPTEYICIARNKWVKHSYIAKVDESGEILCKDGSFIYGDPVRLKEAGLL